jgi:hypothetical protein
MRMLMVIFILTMGACSKENTKDDSLARMQGLWETTSLACGSTQLTSFKATGGQVLIKGQHATMTLKGRACETVILFGLAASGIHSLVFKNGQVSKNSCGTLSAKFHGDLEMNVRRRGEFAELEPASKRTIPCGVLHFRASESEFKPVDIQASHGFIF